MHLSKEDFFKVRKVHRFSTEEYGVICGVSGAYVNMIEKGKRNLTDRIKQRLIQNLELTPEKLVRIFEIYNGDFYNGGVSK